MPILDQRTFLSDGQELTGTTAYSENIIDFGIGKNAFGSVQKNTYNESVNHYNFVNINLKSPPTTAGAISIKIQDSDDGMNFSDTTSSLLLSSGVSKGYTDRIVLPKYCKRYIRLAYSGTNLSGIKIMSWVGFSERD